jgi:hypothetical protein
MPKQPKDLANPWRHRHRPPVAGAPSAQFAIRSSTLTTRPGPFRTFYSFGFSRSTTRSTDTAWKVLYSCHVGARTSVYICSGSRSSTPQASAKFGAQRTSREEHRPPSRRGTQSCLSGNRPAVNASPLGLLESTALSLVSLIVFNQLAFFFNGVILRGGKLYADFMNPLLSKPSKAIRLQ